MAYDMTKPTTSSPRQHPRKATDYAIRRGLANHLIYTCGKTRASASRHDWYHAAAHTVRDYLTERWVNTMHAYSATDAKRVYYLSLEFLIGRMLSNAALNVGIAPEVRAGLQALGQDYERLEEMECDAALGNGGLGRLAACYLDSMATLDLLGMGYGIRYEFGMFYQRIEKGEQVEHPDNWLRYGNPWEFPRPEHLYAVKFSGHVVDVPAADGSLQHHWLNTETVMAMAYDVPVPGYKTDMVNNLRLWSAKATREFDLTSFNAGDYVGAVEEKNTIENLSKVLYPNDASVLGRELRLRQQYFFVSASIQDILRCFLERHDDFDRLPDKVAIQLNDTHPAIAVAEMMYALVDIYHLPWERAWELTTRVFAYTNHTLMPEALETWPVEMLGRVLPRHLQIIYEINHRFLHEVNHRFPGEPDLIRRVSLIDEEHGRRVRMAYLAVVGSHTINGVSAIHSELLKTSLFADFYRIYPHRFTNVTNGITPRRWLNQCNPKLASLIASRIGDEFVRDLAQLERLAPLVEDAEFREQLRAVKLANKQRLAAHIAHTLGARIDPHSLFDIQVKRIHEYKRQLLNLLHVITLYNRIRSGQFTEQPPRTVIFAGKAAPGYRMAKLIIRLINDVAGIVNHDPAVAGRLRLLFLPNYDVSLAERIIPACDLSEQISTAGTEASGTGNMKMALNGALTIGTLDGANIEICQAVGADNIFIFGLTTHEVAELRAAGYDPWRYYHANAELKQALDMIASGYFCMDEPDRYRPIFDSLTHGGDYYLLLADYASYIACQERAAAAFLNVDEWARRAILNVACMGRFSSDRAVREYAERIWQVQSMPR